MTFRRACTRFLAVVYLLGAIICIAFAAQASDISLFGKLGYLFAAGAFLWLAVGCIAEEARE